MLLPYVNGTFQKKEVWIMLMGLFLLIFLLSSGSSVLAITITFIFSCEILKTKNS